MKFIKTFIFLIFVVILFIVAGCAGGKTPATVKDKSAQLDIDRYDFQVVEHSLANGMKVIVVPRPGAKLASCRILVKTGSLYEEGMMGTGVSHLLEHLVSGGTTAKRAEKEYSRLKDILGGVSNAHTSKTRTVYYIDTTPNHVPLALQVLSEQMLISRFTEREWAREQKVVLEELQRGLDNPTRRMYRLMNETLFLDHPVRLPVIGYKTTVGAVKFGYIQSYYARTYVPSNMILAVVGDVDPLKTLLRINATFGRVPPRAAPVKKLPYEPKPTSPRFAELQMKSAREAKIAIAYRTIPLHHEDLYALDVAAAVLGTGRSGRLNRQLRDKGLVRNISCYSFTPVYDGGTFVISASLDYSKLKDVIKSIDSQLDLLKTGPLETTELDRVKTTMVANHMQSLQSVGDLAEQILVDYQGTGDPKFTMSYLRRIQKVTPEQVRAAAVKYLLAEGRATVVVRPPNTKPASVVLSRWKKAATRPAPVAGIRRFQLPNGLTVLVKEDRTFPSVTIEAYALGGVRLETPETSGLFNLTARALLKGTETMDGARIAERIDELGGRISAGGGYNSFFLTMNAMSQNFDEAFALFAEVLTKPAFEDEQLENLKKNVVQQIRALDANWYSFASKRLKQALYKQAPYRMEPKGNMQSVSAFTSADLKRCHSRYMTPRNMVLAVFGDVDARKVENAVTELLGSMKDEKPIISNIAMESPLEESKIVKTAGPFRTAIIMMGFPSISIRDKEMMPVHEVLVSVLGGAGYPSGLLYKALRGGKEGLVYVVAAGERPFLEPGFVWIVAQTNPKNVARVIGLIEKNLKKVREKPVDKDLLIQAKRQLVVHHANRMQRLAYQSTNSILAELYGNGYAWPDEMLGRIEKVTADQVMDAARKVLAKSITVIITPAAKPGAIKKK